MAEYLGLTAIGWHVMIKNWWDQLLAALALFGVILGGVFVLYATYQKVNKHMRGRRGKLSKVPKAVAHCFNDLKGKTQQLRSQKNSSKQPKSFGVYLGSFETPRTSNQARLLLQWDLLVLDPRQDGVMTALSSQAASAQVLGRLDVSDAIGSNSGYGHDEITQALGTITSILLTHFKRQQDVQSPFTGVLLANWQAHFPPVICNELIEFMISLNLDVYLEVAPPHFLTEDECFGINMELIQGIVCRNGTILSNGDRRNYYQMADMRRALRALARQSSMSGSTVMMWEVIDDEVELTHAVVKRSFNWCSFNTAISWIGPRTALTDADVAAKSTIPGEPLGALMWLKSNEIMAAHDIFRSNDKICQKVRDHNVTYDSLHTFVPDLSAKLAPSLSVTSSEVQRQMSASRLFDWPSGTRDLQTNPYSVSSNGDNYTGRGCFQLGLDCSSDDFADLVQAQHRLRDLNLLERVKPEELRRMGEKLQALYENRSSLESASNGLQPIKELLDFITSAQGDDEDCLKVYVGLHSGFRSTLDVQFWGLYDVDRSSGFTEIYLSGKSGDRTSTLLHTFLSSRHYTRFQCLQAEILLAEQTNGLSEAWELPVRIVQDVEKLTPTELLLLMQRLAFSDSLECVEFSAKIKACCEYQLIEVPSLAQLRALNTGAYLSGEISAEGLVASRLEWYRERGCPHPEPQAALSLFREIDARLPVILRNQQNQQLSQLELVLQTVLQKSQIDASADFLAMAVFCAFRKLALDEVYLEVLDRNPLPNPHADQAACFAEMFALGSQCQSYFDMTSNVLGKILSDRYHAYYKEHQPPRRDDQTTELPTAYASSQVDLDPEAGRQALPVHYRVTFLGIFAVPALIDIMLLTTIGRGLYLSTYMSQEEKTMATTALMISLLLCGAFGTWIGSGGSYYLHSMAFPAMNMFVLTRFVAGVSVWFAGGILSLIIIGTVKGFYAGFIFFVYLVFLSTYLTLLATLAIYQLPGFMFQSGRTMVVTCIPILFISPIITLWVHHDIVVYPCVLAGFLVSLVLGARKVISKWSSWYLNIPSLTDTEVVNWYTTTANTDDPASGVGEGVADVGTTPLPRKALLSAILKEHHRRPWTKATTDKVVLKMAEGYSATMFLMDWYCKYTRTKMPYPFSPTWNLQCKAAIDTIKDMQKGLKLHNAFVHWRHAGNEVWCGVLYFVIALMDKWVALLSGDPLVGLSDAGSSVFRLAVGFSLSYYLIAAVCLDSVALPLWVMANKRTDTAITSLSFLRQAAINDARARRRLYWTNFFKFFFMHAWGLSVAAALMWTFEESRSATIMFMAYVGAYTGLLFYQYNRIYTGSLALTDLLIAAFLGLLIGPLLHRYLPLFQFSSVIALAIATWTTAILSLGTARIGWPKSEKEVHDKATAETPVSHSCSALGPYPNFSQRTMSEIFDSVLALPNEHFRVNPSDHPGVEVMEILLSHGISKRPELIRAAFPSAEQLIQRTAELWMRGDIVIDLVPQRELHPQARTMRTITRRTGDQSHVFVFVGLDLVHNEWTVDIRRNCKIIAEAVVQAAAEKLGLSHDHSALASMLLAGQDGADTLSIPESIKRQLEGSAAERKKIIQNGNKEMLRHLLLGIDSDRAWDDLPETTRSILLRRCCGEPLSITDAQSCGILSTICRDDATDFEQQLARSNLGAALAVLIQDYAKALEADYHYHEPVDRSEMNYEKFIGASLMSNTSVLDPERFDWITRPFYQILFGASFALKFFVVSLVADPEFQRELDYVISGKTFLIRWPARLVYNGIWLYCKAMQRFILPLVLFHGRENVSTLYSNMRGIKTTIAKQRVIIEGVSGPSTGFFKNQPDGSPQLHQYSGRHEQEPSGSQHLLAINTYTDKLVLCRREEYVRQSLANVYTYEYSQDSSNATSKLPISRHCIEGNRKGHIAIYDSRGYITSGSYIKDDNLVEFQLWYRKHARFDDELLRAEFVLPHITMKVSWSVPPPKHSKKLNSWIPYTKVIDATFTQGPDVYRSNWNYDHRSHPVITTTLNGEPVATPPMIQHDWFDVLSKPTNCSFLADNLLFSFNSINTSFVSRLLGLNTKRYAISTSRARTHLWKSWKEGKQLDAVTTRWLDEKALRSDRVLTPYWLARDLGLLKKAGKYLDLRADVVMARTDIDPDISAWSSLAYKLSDLYTFGQGGDARINTRTVATQLRDDVDTLHVLAMDTGTWPNEGGGVSACRRDMVNDLKTIRWHVLAESANDFGTPKFQIERNVQSLTVLPLWGLDFLTPTHGVFVDFLDSEVQTRSQNTRNADIKKKFFPILTTLVRCSRAIKFERHHIEEATRALVDLNDYFESTRHWSEVWTSDIVKQKWRELWLTEDMENAVPISEWLNAECPTLLHLDNALDMWHRYLFIFSLPVPEEIPDVFQASHHFAGASYGVLCKVKRNCTLHVWDHCISWREVTVFLSSAMSFDSPFVCTSLISLSRMTSVLILHHADVVLPCADFFNPEWEVEHGTCAGVLEHRRTFARKIDPVVNGICNMESFKPIEKIKSKIPTVTMLSHVRFVKDIKNAILAADIIVNKWGFTDYQLHIYGDMEKAPAYSVECKEILAAKGLRDHVVLKGLGSPTKVLEEAWLFLNSSISEGLPLAMGEAALTGVPVVCTDVGASFRVVTDPVTWKKFSAVVAPNDSLSLARAQVNVLALLDEWSEYADDAPGYRPKMSLNPSQEEVKMITGRMYEKTEQRRRLGMVGRNNVLSSFSSDRYLREHEQMLWIGKTQSPSYIAKSGRSTPTTTGSIMSLSRPLLARDEEKESIEVPTRRFSSILRKSQPLLARDEEEDSIEVPARRFSRISRKIEEIA